MSRTDSLPRTIAIALGALGACVALTVALALGADGAEGKEKKAGKTSPLVLSSSQHQILTSGAIEVRGGRNGFILPCTDPGP